MQLRAVKVRCTLQSVMKAQQKYFKRRYFSDTLFVI